MKRLPYPSLAILIILVAFATKQSFAQDTPEGFLVPRTNSRAVIQQTIASTLVEVRYNRPNKKGREVFGHFISYDAVWRTGADEATTIYFSTPISLSGHPLDSGRYELFTIPGENEWQIILQEHQQQWGSYRYNEEKDVLRFSVAPKQLRSTLETFTISIDQIGADCATLHLAWDKTIVPIDLKVDLRSTVIPELEKTLQASERPPYFQAAMFYFENKLDLDRAEALMALALERNPEHIGMLYRYALILQEQGNITAAIKACQASLAGAQEIGQELGSEYIRLNSALLQELNKTEEEK